MAPKFAPKVWKRPHTSIYNDNYRYGNSLYSEQITDIERRYNESLASTRLRPDRLDLGMSSFSDSQLIGASESAKSRSDRAHENYLAERVRNSISMPRVSQALHDSDLRRLHHSPSFDSSYNSTSNDDSRLRRSASRVHVSRPPRPESHYSAALDLDAASKPSDNFWMERCKEMQIQIENLKQELSDTQDKVRHGTTFVKSKVDQEIGDLMHTIEDQSRQIGTLEKHLKKQSKQVSDLSMELAASTRQYADVNEQLHESSRKSSNMAHEVEQLRSNLEKVTVKSPLTELEDFEMQRFNTELAFGIEELQESHARTVASIARAQKQRQRERKFQQNRDIDNAAALAGF